MTKRFLFTLDTCKNEGTNIHIHTDEDHNINFWLPEKKSFQVLCAYTQIIKMHLVFDQQQQHT